MSRIVFASLFVLFGFLPSANGQDKDPKGTRQRGQGGLRFDLDRLMKDYDGNKDGFLDRKEAPPFLLDHFDALDANNDGKLSRDEIQKGMSSLQPRRRPSDLLLILIEMSECDEDCTGEIQQIYNVLRRMDVNKDGRIDADELGTVRKQIMGERVDRLFKELDRNRDGRISREEAKGQLKRNFDRIDENKDGFIDRDELLRAAAERPQRTSDRVSPNSK